MSILTITDNGINAVTNAQAGGFLLNLTHFKVGNPPSGFPISNTDSGLYFDAADGMSKDTSGNSYVKYESEISRIAVLHDGAVQFTLIVPAGFPAMGETWALTEIGLYLEDGTLFAHGESLPSYPKQFDYGIEIRCVVVLTRLCDVINIVVGNDARLASTIVRRLESPAASTTNAFIVLDQHNNYDQTTSPSIALQYGNGNDSWGYVGYTRIYYGPVVITQSLHIELNPASSGFWLLDREPVIVQIVRIPNPGATGIGESRRMIFDAQTNTFNEADGKAFSVATDDSVYVSIWRDPAWMLSTYGVDSDIELHTRTFNASAGDFFFDLEQPIDASSALVHVDGVFQSESYYITATKIVFNEPFTVAAKVSVKWSANTEGNGFGIKFNRTSTVGTGALSYAVQLQPAYNAENDVDPLFYVDRVHQTPTFDTVTNTVNFGASVNTDRTIDGVFFEKYPIRGTPVLKKFVFPGGSKTYRSPLGIADEHHVLVYVGQVYQKLSTFTVVNNTVVLGEAALKDQKVTLFVSSVIFSRRNVALYDEYAALRDYVFCKLGRPDERLFNVAVSQSATDSLRLVEPLELDAPFPLLVTANSVVQSTYSTNAIGTYVSVSENLVAGGKLSAHQILSNTFGRQMYAVEERSYVSAVGQSVFGLPKPCRDAANLIVTVDNAIQISSFKLVGRNSSIEFSEQLRPNTKVRIIQLFNISDVNGPFACEDFRFVSTGEDSFDLGREVDSKESLLVFAGCVPQLRFDLSENKRSILFNEAVPVGVPVTVKHIHQRCFSATFLF